MFFVRECLARVIENRFHVFKKKKRAKLVLLLPCFMFENRNFFPFFYAKQIERWGFCLNVLKFLMQVLAYEKKIQCKC